MVKKASGDQSYVNEKQIELERCETNRCACRKAGQMCNSRCHPNLACKNK
jgi:hypothetical protein